MTIKTSRALTRAAIVEALGYIPADTAAVTMADGSPASAGMKFANNATGSSSGFFRSFIGSSSDIVGIALNGTTGFQLYGKQILAPLDSVTFQGTGGGTVTSAAAEHYPFTITPGSWTLGVAGARMIGM